MTKYAAAIERVTDYWPNIEEELPNSIGDGGKQAILLKGLVANADSDLSSVFQNAG